MKKAQKKTSPEVWRLDGNDLSTMPFLMAIWLYFNMKKQDDSKILLKLIDNTAEIEMRMNLFSDYIRRLVDELREVSTGTIGDEIIDLLSLAVGEMTGEVNALDNEIKHADEARGVPEND